MFKSYHIYTTTINILVFRDNLFSHFYGVLWIYKFCILLFFSVLFHRLFFRTHINVVYYPLKSCAIVFPQYLWNIGSWTSADAQIPCRWMGSACMNSTSGPPLVESAMWNLWMWETSCNLLSIFQRGEHFSLLLVMQFKNLCSHNFLFIISLR